VTDIAEDTENTRSLVKTLIRKIHDMDSKIHDMDAKMDLILRKLKITPSEPALPKFTAAQIEENKKFWIPYEKTKDD
jgi:hypothetical protein